MTKECVNDACIAHISFLRRRMTGLVCRIFGHRWLAVAWHASGPSSVCCRCGRVRGAGQ